MNKSVTAVSYLELKLLGLISFDSEHLRLKYKSIIKQAKELEKEQIIKAHKNGKSILPPNENGEQYYNETFK